MNLVRSVMTVFLLALLFVTIAGWIWAGGQPSPKLEGARTVLTLCIVGSLGAIGLLWTARNPMSQQ